jgi:hypothetical protein
MPVVGRHAYILSDNGRTADVSAFTPDYKPMEVRIVDAAVQYECPYSSETYVLVIRNALHVPSMKSNLIPPFIMRETGIQVNETAKIHRDDPSVEDHSVYFPETKFRIPLALWGVFSYFPTSKPSVQTLQECEETYVLTPSKWDPHQNAYASNEENMLDWQGEMVEKKYRKRILLSEIKEDEAMSVSMTICSIESRLIDRILEYDSEEQVSPCYELVPRAADQVSSVLASVDPLLNDQTLYHRLTEQANLGRFQTTIGSTNATYSKYLEEDDDTIETDSSTEDDDESDLLDKILEDSNQGKIDLDDIMAGAIHAKRNQGVDAMHLSKIWKIDLDSAKRTLNVTAQNSVRTEDPKLSRNYGTNDRMLRYKRIKEYFFMDTFFATKKAGKSSRGHTCCQLFVTDKGFVYVVPMKSKSEVLQAVKQFAKEIGAPDTIISDAAGEQRSNELRKFCSEIGTTLRLLEEGTPWANKAELYIGIIKEAVRKDMRESNCPLVLWDYCVERRARINNMTAKNSFKLHGTNAHTDLTSEEGDISNLCQYGWYDWCYFREKKEKFPFNREVLGRVLGPAKGEGNEMAQWVLKANGQVVPRRTLRPLHVAEIHSPMEEKKREIFDKLIERKHGTAITPPKIKEMDDSDNSEENWEEYEDDVEDPRVVPDIEDTVDKNGRLLNQQPAYDRLINAEVQLQLGEKILPAKVVRRALGPDGHVTGEYHENPMLNSIVYEAEFPDGEIKEYSANVIAENMLTQVDSEGFSLTMIEGIVDYRKDEATAVSKADMYVVTQRGQKKLRKSTAGWKLLVRWKDQTESWIHLKDLKESQPVETAEFAKSPRNC